MYFWPPEGLGLWLEIVVAERVFRTHFEQSASGSGRYDRDSIYASITTIGLFVGLTAIILGQNILQDDYTDCQNLAPLTLWINC